MTETEPAPEPTAEASSKPIGKTEPAEPDWLKGVNTFVPLLAALPVAGLVGAWLFEMAYANGFRIPLGLIGLEAPSIAIAISCCVAWLVIGIGLLWVVALIAETKHPTWWGAAAVLGVVAALFVLWVLSGVPITIILFDGFVVVAVAVIVRSLPAWTLRIAMYPHARDLNEVYALMAKNAAVPHSGSNRDGTIEQIRKSQEQDNEAAKELLAQAFDGYEEAADRDGSQEDDPSLEEMESEIQEELQEHRNDSSEPGKALVSALEAQASKVRYLRQANRSLAVRRAELDRHRQIFKGLVLRFSVVATKIEERRRWVRPLLWTLVFFVFAYQGGDTVADNKLQYPVRNVDGKDLVVLAIYGETMVSAPLDRDAKTVKPEFYITKVNEGSEPLRIESLGPLRLEQ